MFGIKENGKIKTPKEKYVRYNNERTEWIVISFWERILNEKDEFKMKVIKSAK